MAEAAKAAAIQAATVTASVTTPLAPITRDQLGVALIALATEKGRDVTMAVLKQFGAEKLGGVKIEDYSRLSVAIQQASNL